MSAFLEVSTDEGAVLFEIDAAQAERTERISRREGSVVASLDERLDEVLARARPAAKAISTALSALEPDELEVEFGITVDGQVGAVIAKTGVSSHFNVKLTWKREATRSG